MSHAEDLTVKQALEAILGSISVLSSEPVPIVEALGRVLAAAVVAQESLPPFANSSMDGYAVLSSDLAGVTIDNPAHLKVVADIAAGAVSGQSLNPGEAARIMTGASMPEGADALVPVESTNEPWRNPERPLPEIVQVYRAVGSGDYVRHIGEDIRSGTEVMAAGHLLRPQEIGVLASLGIEVLSVVRRPKVAVLATGDELLPISEPLSPGKIRNSNEYAQIAQVTAMGAIPIPLGIARDDEDDVREKLQQGLDAGADLFVSSAGVSVGAYDVVKKVLEDAGNVGFWRVRMRPGKPLAFGSYLGVPYLGLPGNPVSAMVSFERFARAAILKMSGHAIFERPQVDARVTEVIHSDGRESYIRAVVSKGRDGYYGTPTGSQGSHIMTSLVKANALLIVPEGVNSVAAGDKLKAWMIDWPETVF